MVMKCVDPPSHFIQIASFLPLKHPSDWLMGSELITFGELNVFWCISNFWFGLVFPEEQNEMPLGSSAEPTGPLLGT